MEKSKPFWNPYMAGIALGLVLLASFVLTGRGGYAAHRAHGVPP